MRAINRFVRQKPELGIALVLFSLYLLFLFALFSLSVN